MTTKKQIKVYLPMAYGCESPLGGQTNFFYTKEEAKAVVKKYIAAGIIRRGWIDTAIYES